MSTLQEKFFEASARLEQVIFLGGAGVGSGEMSEQLRTLFEEEFAALEACFGPLPQDLKDALSASDALDEIDEWLTRSGKLGFAVQFATPVMKHSPAYSSYSWGQYRTRWVYGDTFDEALEAGFSWVAERRADERKNAK